MFDVLSHFMLFYCKISLLCDLRCFVAKTVLSRFTRFGVEKIGPKILSVEKKGQISGMGKDDIGGPNQANLKALAFILWCQNF